MIVPTGGDFSGYVYKVHPMLKFIVWWYLESHGVPISTRIPFELENTLLTYILTETVTHVVYKGTYVQSCIQLGLVSTCPVGRSNSDHTFHRVSSPNLL
jgi:hypothetical protein